VHVADDVFIVPVGLREETGFEHDGEPGLWAKVHWMFPVGAGVVLLGGTTVALKVSVSPYVGVAEDDVAFTSTVVVAKPRATKLSDPPEPSGAWAVTVICCEPLFGHEAELLFTQLELWASHCWTGLLTEIE
jgi:hypothetical protein